MASIKYNYLQHFKSDLLSLKLVGVWINYDLKVSKYYFLVVNVFFIVLLNSMCVIYWILNSNSIKSFAALGYILMVCLMGQTKSFFIYLYRDTFENLIGQFKEELFQPRNTKEMLIAKQNLKFYWNIKTVLVVVSFIATLSSISVPLFYQKGDGLPINAWYPVNVTSTPLFQIAYIHQSISLVYIAVINIYTDVLVAGFFTFTGLQCDILCERLEKLGHMRDLKNKISLETCVQHHWLILKFAHTTEKVFGIIYFAQIFASTIALCMDLFLLTLTEPKTFEFFYLVVYQIAIANLIHMPCWFASELTRKSENIPNAAYFCDWTDASISFKKDLIFFISRSQRPIKLYTVSFFEMSVDTFVKIIRSSLSYYAVLNNLNMAEEELTE